MRSKGSLRVHLQENPLQIHLGIIQQQTPKVFILIFVWSRLALVFLFKDGLFFWRRNDCWRGVVGQALVLLLKDASLITEVLDDKLSSGV